MDDLLLEIKDGIAAVTLNRPGAFNAFDEGLIGALGGTMADLASNTEVKAVVLTGAGKAFCAGGDLKRIHKLGIPYGPSFHRLAARYHQAIVEIRRMPKPVTAALNGLAVGGGFSLALSCDFRVMSEGATLVQGYTTNGLSIDGGGTFMLPRLVGLARAMEIAAFDRPISPARALEWGLVTEVVEEGQSMDRAMELSRELCTRAGSSFAASKELLNDSFESPLERQLERERACLARCADSPNGVEGISAFVEKRTPSYK